MHHLLVTSWGITEFGVRRLALIAFLLTTAAAWAGPLEEAWPADGQPLATLSWTNREVTAIGRAQLRPGRPLAFAERAARLDAYANLAQAARLARVDTRRRVGELVTNDDQFAQGFEAFLRLTEFGPPDRGDDGWVTVHARTPLFAIDVDPRRPAAELGPLVYRRDDVWASDVERHREPAGQGVLLDGRQLGVAGAFAPLIEDEDGRVVWTVECTTHGLAETDGAVDYQVDWQIAVDSGRAGEDPLVIRPLRADGPRLIVSVADGLRLAPRRQADTGWQFVFWRGIRTITPVSPFQRLSVVSTAADDESQGTAPGPGREG